MIPVIAPFPLSLQAAGVGIMPRTLCMPCQAAPRQCNCGPFTFFPCVCLPQCLMEAGQVQMGKDNQKRVWLVPWVHPKAKFTMTPRSHMPSLLGHAL